MKSFNKMLYETIKNLNISKKDYIQLLTLLHDLINIGKEKEKLEIEIQKLKRELWFISSQNQREYAKSLNFTLDEKYNGKKIDLIKRELFTREQIFHIISQNEKIQDLKSSIIKPTKNIKSLNHELELRLNEIKKLNEDLIFYNPVDLEKNNIKNYINRVKRTELPKIKEKILIEEYKIATRTR